MCGIAGIFSFNGRPLKNLKSRIYKMTKMEEHYLNKTKWKNLFGV